MALALVLRSDQGGFGMKRKRMIVHAGWYLSSHEPLLLGRAHAGGWEKEMLCG